MKEILIVTKETFLRQVKSWSFLLMVISPFIFLAFTFGIGFISGSTTEKSNQIAIILPDASMKPAFKAIDEASFAYHDPAKAKKDLKADKILAYVTVTTQNKQVTANYYSKAEPSVGSKALMTQALNHLQQELNLASTNISPEQLQLLFTQAKINLKTNKHQNYDKIGKSLSFFAITFIMYMILIIYSAQTAQEIASEKGTKIMEVIFSSIPADQYFFGRILGILSVIVTHVSIYVIGGFLCYQWASRSTITKDMIKPIKPLLSSVFKHLDWSMIVFAVLGILLFVVLAALCGSLVVRPEQANQAAQPAIFLVVAAFMGAFILGQTGSDSLLLKIGSYLPFFSSFFMPIRLINGFAGLTESIISLLVLAFTTLALIGFIGKSYSGLILQTDDIGFLKGLKKGLTHN